MDDGTTIFIVADGWHMAVLGLYFGLGTMLAIGFLAIAADIAAMALRWLLRAAPAKEQS